MRVDEALLLLGGFDPEPGPRGRAELLSLPEPPTAIFAANDCSALATLEVAAELGIDVPGQLSVVGFDNIPESALAHPPLTTVQQPMRQMGHDAITMLVPLIAGEEIADTHITLDTTLVVAPVHRAPGGDLVTELWRDPRRRRRPGRRPGRPDDAAPRRSAQLSGVWGVDPDVGEMAPMLRDGDGTGPAVGGAIADGLGQLTRPFGTVPVEPRDGLRGAGGAAARGDGGQPVRDPGPGARGDA